MRDELNKFKYFTRRAFSLLSLKLLLFFTLAARYYYLQIIEGKKYRTLSENNRIKVAIIPAMRGLIVDRNQHPIAKNRLAYRAVIESKKRDLIKEYLAKIGAIIGRDISLSDQEIDRRIQKSYPHFRLTVFEQIEWEEVTKLELHGATMPQLKIEQIESRIYPLKELTAQFTGYTGLPTPTELEALDYSSGAQDIQIGKNGIEKSFDRLLQGTPGIDKIEIDALGRKVRILETQAAHAGNTLTLTINLALQSVLNELLQDKVGCITVLDALSGEVLAMHSSPSYDPNLFVGGISHQDWEHLSQDPDSPMINKTISFAYPPGSLFKPIVATAALQHGISPHESVVCTGKHQVGNRTFHCWKRGGHGRVDLEKAIAQSCNIYFYHVAEKIGIASIAEAARRYGLGAKSGIALPFESAGNIPDRHWKLQRYNKKWVLGDTINTAIGQGFVLATPLQLAVLAARIASGNLVDAHITPQRGQLDKLRFTARHVDIIRHGMSAVFNYQHGLSFQHRFLDPAFQIAGKTGTAQVISERTTTAKHLQDHGLFMGFAPVHAPRYAISIVVEHGSWGSKSALPLGIEVFKWLQQNGDHA